jgi:uncharacterized repeat protein (TIGR01451 family)/fimbrial isopeptide formation D2 family protein
VEVIFFFNRLIAASRYLLVFFLRCWLRAVPLKNTRSKLWAAWLGTTFGVIALLLASEAALAAPCDLRSSPQPFIQHDLTSSYCELCGYGYVTVIVSNSYEEVDIIDMTVVENLLNSGLTFDPTAPNPVTYRVNGGASQAGLAPTLSGVNDSILTWTSAQIPALSRLEYDPLPPHPPYTTITDITITFAVTRESALTQEGLVGADRSIQASLTYDTDGVVDCFPGSTTVSTGLDTLTLREPNPDVTKRGRNVDANQGSWTSTVYGNVDDDVIWRIQVSNTAGTADLQDLRFDDLMQDGSLDINYACPTYTAATNVTGNNGVDPGGGGCVPASNTISDFDVDNPFGNPGSDSPDIVDVPQGGSAYIYLVGKIRSAPDGSCTYSRTNTVSDIQWGCEDDSPPAGGIFQTSDGDNPGSDTTTLYTRYGERANLSVERRLTGTNTSQPVGSKGTMTIIIRNETGGSVKNITMADVLPVEYVMDPTFIPTVTMDPRYGTYDGMIDNITWDNQDADPLNNTAPEFTLTSSGCSIGPCDDTVHPFYPDQQDMMRDGDELTIVFRVVLIKPSYYDKVANLDVREEDDADGTDPDNQTTLSNTLTVEFDTFCAAQGHQTLTLTGNGTATNGSAIQAFPEDIDIDFDSSGGDLVFILTGDPSQRLPLTVELTNNGGHDAEDYVAYVSFGRTMDVVTVPSGCSLTGNPPAHDEWHDPATIPATAAIYACTGSAISPGQTVSRTFEVVKSTDAADIAADDLTFRADVVGEIRLSDGTLLTFPTPINPRADGGNDLGNNYSLDGIRARVIGFNLLKSQVGNCTENNPPPSSPDVEVQIGEECSYHIDTGGWFGFQTPGYSLIAVQDITVYDQLPNGQGYISSTDPYLTSTSAIQSISLNPAGLTAPNEVTAPDYMNWTFNWSDALRITEMDHWFRVDMTSRLLNDPVDVSAAPNQHADLSTNVLVSNFRALFQNDITGELESYLLGPSTVGYPRLAVRNFSLTVTEPHITVVKEVCNESLYGTGPSCTNFVPLADDGDAYNSYIYRITLTNEARSDGVDRAPAYDVTVTDTLDASDLAYVLPFAGDSLDNDADSVTDEAGANSEGTISDNIVKNGTPAQLTFSYTHSTALARIDPGDSVQLYYRVDYDDDAAPLQTFTNTAGSTYDSLTGTSGNQSVPQCSNSEACGARFYTSDTTSSSVQIIPVVTQPKEIADLSNTPLASSGTQEAVVGEEIEYRLTTSLPVALLRNFVVRDELPTGLRCSEAPAVNLDAAPYSDAGFEPGGTITPTCTDNLVQWDFGNQRVTNGTVGNRYDFEIGFIARVENTANTNNGDVISNGDPATEATASYIDEADNSVVLNFGQVDIQVTEPLIVLTKTFAVANADAADVLTVTVTANNTGTAPAYNLRVLDDLSGRNMTFVGNVGGSDPPDTTDTSTLGANKPIFSWNTPNNIDPGATISFTFDVRVDSVVQPNEVLDNTIQADWTSLPGQTTALNSTGMIGANGSETGMRNGALPNAGGAINDYETSAANQVTVPSVTLTKTDLDPAAIPAIGLHKNFQLDISLPEGVTNDVILTDSLDATGLSYILENNAVYDITYTFQGISSINGQAPGEAAFSAFPTDGASGSIVWNIGTVNTQTEDDTSENAINPLIRIQYYARVNNDLVTDSGDTLQNGAVLNYTNGETGAQETLSDAAAAVTVVEPVLAAAKTVSNVTPGKQPADPPEGGDLIEYVIAVLNSGTSIAHDVNIVDTLPSALSLYTGFTPTATIDGAPAAGFVATPANAPNGPLVWGRNNSDDSLDIPVGQSLVLTYRAVVQAAGGDISNSAMVDWTSLDGNSSFERTGEGCPAWTAPNDYCTGPAVATTTTVDNNSVDKTVSADTFDTAPWSTAADAVARIGDFITYRLALNLSGGLTRNLQVQDTLPGGMAFVETVSINGDTSADYTAPGTGAGSNFAYAPISSANVPTTGQTGTLAWTIGDVVNDPFGDPTTDALVIIYRARILPDAGIAHVASTTLTNTANMDYETAAGPATTQTDSASITVVQPDLTVAKSAVASGGDTVLAADEIVTYTVDIINNGGAPAYDTLLTDIIPVGLRNGTATITMVSMQLLSGTTLPSLAPVYDAATGIATWNFDTGVADQYAIPAGDTLRIVYQAQAETGIGAGLTLINEAQVQRYYSLDDEDIPTHGGVDGEPQIYGPSNIATVTFTTATPDALIKDNPAVLTVAVGEPFSYRVTVPATPQDTALHDVRILDDLSTSAADLIFVSVTKVSGSQPWTPVNTGSTTNLVIEDTTTGIDIPAGEQIVIDITVILDDTSTNVSGLQFNNTADYTYNQIDNDPATQAPGGSDTTDNMTIVGADTLTLEKSGPATVQLETPATYTLNIHNTSTGTVWNPIITDRIPNEATGGMCDAGPSSVSARIYLADGVTPVSSPLVEDTDFTVEFDGDPTCEWRFNLLSPVGGIPSDQRLIVNYDMALDPSTENGLTLTNVAGVTRWYSADPNATGAAPRIFDRVLTDGTPGTLDHEDNHTITTEAPILAFEKSVQNITTGQNPGSNASPGDTLRYTITVSNSGPVGFSSFSIVDEVDHLNSVAAFAAGSLNIISVPAGADTSGTSAVGGTQGTGLLNVANLAIGAQGESNDTIEVIFEIELAPAITSGTVVLNQAEIVSANPNPILSDDPNISGDTDPTETLITSAPIFQVQKISTIMSGDPTVLMAGETLRYTITIKNIGNEDAVNTSLRDYTPANTTYVAGSTTLNGNAVSDTSPGVNPLHAGILINAPENTTAGYLRADTSLSADNVATITFDVVVDSNAMNGLIIENQGFVSGSGAGSGSQPEQPSDDPNTPIPDDPTRNIVGNLPLLYAHKTVQIYQDFGSPGIVDPGDILRYTIDLSNFGAIPATSVVVTDAVPTNTTYVADSLRLNGISPGPDGGVSPLIAGLTVQSSDNPGAGIVSAGESAVITFEAEVNAGVPVGTLITNQGSVTSSELPPEATDADGVPSNGNQPTVIVVGDVQLLSVTKQVLVVGGGTAEAGGQLEYVIRATNIGSLPATLVAVTDDLSPPLGDQVSYVAGSGTLNGSASGVTYAGAVLTANYAAQYGDLQPGASAVVRFRVLIDPALAMGTTITNIGVVSWNNPTQTASASVSIDVGGTPGSASLNGNVWHDANLDKISDGSTETMLENWSVELYYNSQLVTTVTTDANGDYQLNGLLPNDGTSNVYELRFLAAGAGANTPSLGYADSVFTNGPQRISDISVASGANLQNLNLPLWPNGVVYNSVEREPVAGATVALLNATTGEALPSQCFDDPVQQNQVTALDGFYKFDLNFSQASCPAGGAYLIEISPPTSGYMDMPSQIIPSSSDASTAPFSVPTCPGSADDAVPATAEYCEAVALATAPPPSVQPRTAGTVYYLHLMLSNGNVPGQSQVFNNAIPLDPELDGAVAITKTSSMTNVTRGTLVPYTITVTNVYGSPLYDISIVDRFPAGFKYVSGSARLDGNATEPRVNGRELAWDNLELQVNQKYTIQLLLVVGSGVSEGEYVNRAVVYNTATGGAVSGEATATVRVVPDPDFDCTSVIGKVFDDPNLNGHQDPGEKGLPGIRVVTVRGLITTTDKHGRFHITCAAVPDEDRGSNFILKLDERSLPTGYRMTTENPRVQRATRGKMIRFNFGATIHRVVRMDIADGVFEPNTSDLRIQWAPKIVRLLKELKKAPSVLRLSYLGDVEEKSLVQKRLEALKKTIIKQWKQTDGGYRLAIETEIFWRRGAPLAGQ